MARKIEEQDEHDDNVTEKTVDDVIETENKVVIDEDADDEKDEVQAEDRAKLSRKERRQQRWHEMMDKQYERGRAEADARIKALEAQLQAISERISTSRPREEEDDIPPPIREIDEQMETVVGKIANLPNTAEGKRQEAELTKKYRQLEFKKYKTIQESFGQKHQEPDDVEFGRRMLRLEYPQVYGNERVRTAAAEEMESLIRSGHPESIETARLAATNVMARLGMSRNAAKPSDAQKAKYAAVPARAGEGAGPRTVTLDKMQMQMARAWAKGRTSDDREAAEIFVREVLRPNGLA